MTKHEHEQNESLPWGTYPVAAMIGLALASAAWNEITLGTNQAKAAAAARAEMRRIIQESYHGENTTPRIAGKTVKIPSREQNQKVMGR